MHLFARNSENAVAIDYALHSIQRGWIAGLSLALLPVIYFFPAVKGDVVLLMGDSWAYSVLMRMLLGQMISEGILPLWNPYTFAGMPFLATLQPGALYPPNWLFAVLAPGAAMNLVVITTYHIALAGTYRFARAAGLDRLASLVAAVTFSFGGFFITHLEFTNYIAPAAWLPWILLAIERLSQRASWRWVALGAASVALQCFAGLPQATWQILIVAAPYSLFALFRLKERGRRWRFLFHALAMAVCGFLLSAIQLFPAMELQHQGERARIDYEAFSIFSMPVRRLVTLIFPFFFGGGHPPLYRVGGWDEWWSLKMVYGYVGFLGLLLGLIAVFSSRGGSRRALVWFWTAIAAISLMMSFGSNLPFELNRLFYQIPINNLFRCPYRHLFEFTFAFAMLAGRDTAEWAYDRADVKASAQHRRAPLVESWASDGFEGHRYLARFAFDRAEIEQVEIASLLAPSDANAKLVILRASLHDATTGDSTAMDRAMFPAERWRRIARFGRIDVLENLRFLPRAWFVERLVVQPTADVLRTIREGRLADGATFDPARIALAAMEDFGGRDLPATGATGAQVNLTRYEPLRIELQTRNEKPGFLVLSEIYYRGWEAKVDGKRVPVERVNHTLRGIMVPAGDHRIGFFFRAPSFRLGAKYSLIGVVLLLAGGILSNRRHWWNPTRVIERQASKHFPFVI